MRTYRENAATITIPTHWMNQIVLKCKLEFLTVSYARLKNVLTVSRYRSYQKIIIVRLIYLGKLCGTMINPSNITVE